MTVTVGKFRPGLLILPHRDAVPPRHLSSNLPGSLTRNDRVQPPTRKFLPRHVRLRPPVDPAHLHDVHCYNLSTYPSVLASTPRLKPLNLTPLASLV